MDMTMQQMLFSAFAAGLAMGVFCTMFALEGRLARISSILQAENDLQMMRYRECYDAAVKDVHNLLEDISKKQRYDYNIAELMSGRAA